MVEFFPATGVYWYPAAKHYVLSKSSNPTQLTGNCVDSFFSKDVLKVSNLKGGGMGRYCPLNHRLISAIQCKVICHPSNSNSQQIFCLYTAFVVEIYSGTKLSTINNVINQKYTSARRGVSKQQF